MPFSSLAWRMFSSLGFGSAAAEKGFESPLGPRGPLFLTELLNSVNLSSSSGVLLTVHSSIHPFGVEHLFFTGTPRLIYVLALSYISSFFCRSHLSPLTYLGLPFYLFFDSPLLLNSFTPGLVRLYLLLLELLGQPDILVVVRVPRKAVNQTVNILSFVFIVTRSLLPLAGDFLHVTS